MTTAFHLALPDGRLMCAQQGRCMMATVGEAKAYRESIIRFDNGNVESVFGIKPSELRVGEFELNGAGDPALFAMKIHEVDHAAS